MNASCPRSGISSTWETAPRHGLAAPKRAAGASVKGCTQETFVASAVASSRIVSGVSVSGIFLIRPSVCSSAHASASACDGSGPVSTDAGRADSHASMAGVGADASHRAAADTTAGCGSSSRAVATERALARSMPSACSSSPADGPSDAAGAHSAANSQAPRGDATWWEEPAGPCSKRAYRASGARRSTAVVMHPLCQPRRVCADAWPAT